MPGFMRRWCAPSLRKKREFNAIIFFSIKPFIAYGIHSHAFFVIRAFTLESTGDKLVEVRNPWGKSEYEVDNGYTGKWHDKDPRWTDALREEAGHPDKNEGSFIMDLATGEFDRMTRINDCFELELEVVPHSEAAPLLKASGF